MFDLTEDETNRLGGEWDTFNLLPGERETRARLCPVCSAWVWSPVKHRDWHLNLVGAVKAEAMRRAATSSPNEIDIRDYFAVRAMQAAISDARSVVAASANARLEGVGGCEWIANGSYEMADAMLAARSKSLKPADDRRGT